MNKKGFTLIELLAVIVILAVIALIATPIILNVIEDSKQGAFKNSIHGVIKAAELELYNALEKGEVEYPREYVFEESNPYPRDIEYKGKPLTSGMIVFDNEKTIRIDNVNDGSYCGYGIPEDIQIKKGPCKVMMYQTREKNTVYGAWSGWTTTACTASDICEVEAGKLYSAKSCAWGGWYSTGWIDCTVNSCRTANTIEQQCISTGQEICSINGTFADGNCSSFQTQCKSVPCTQQYIMQTRCNDCHWSGWTTTACSVGANCQQTTGYRTRTSSVEFGEWSEWTTTPCSGDIEVCRSEIR